MSAASILSLDVGGSRIGVAIASSEARLPRPLITLPADNYLQPLQEIIHAQTVEALVVGYPRGLQGQSTAQTKEVEDFARQLEILGLPVHLQDESVTSKQAEAELQARDKPYQKGDIDALAATYILEDWLAGNQETTA